MLPTLQKGWLQAAGRDNNRGNIDSAKVAGMLYF